MALAKLYEKDRVSLNTLLDVLATLCEEDRVSLKTLLDGLVEITVTQRAGPQ